jgi:hypothetical protein
MTITILHPERNRPYPLRVPFLLAYGRGLQSSEVQGYLYDEYDQQIEAGTPKPSPGYRIWILRFDSLADPANRGKTLRLRVVDPSYKSAPQEVTFQVAAPTVGVDPITPVEPLPNATVSTDFLTYGTTDLDVSLGAQLDPGAIPGNLVFGPPGSTSWAFEFNVLAGDYNLKICRADPMINCTPPIPITVSNS